MLIERRCWPRRRTLKEGRIVFDDKRSVIDCTVLNLSDKGANLHLPSFVDVPDSFELQDLQDDEVHAPWAVWKADGTLGVT